MSSKKPRACSPALRSERAHDVPGIRPDLDKVETPRRIVPRGSLLMSPSSASSHTFHTIPFQTLGSEVK
jgi:hypothetical protein